MDRFEFENHCLSSVSVPLANVSTTATLLPMFNGSEWLSIATIRPIVEHGYTVAFAGGIVFCLLTLLTLIQNVYMTSKPYLFTQTIFDLLFLLVAAYIHKTDYVRSLIPQLPHDKIYYYYLFYVLWFIIIWLFLISCLDHTCTAIQSSGYNEKLFCTPCNSTNSIIGIVLLGVIFSLPQLFVWKSDETNSKQPSLRESVQYKHIYFWFLHVIYLFIPLFSIFVFMGTLSYTLCRKKEHYLLTSNGNHYGHYTIHYANPHENSIHYSKTRERENITKFFIFMCFLCLLFVLPYSFILFFGKLLVREQTGLLSKSLCDEILIAFDISLLLIYIQILMKFFALTIFSTNFRLCLKKLITCQCFCCCFRCCSSKSSVESNEHNHNDSLYMK